MSNIKPLLKRVCAYTIDTFIVLIISSLISSIPVFSKNMDNYQKTYEEYEEKYNKYSKFLTSLQETYEDKEITKEEYEKLTESEKYSKIITSKYDDEKITQKEYKTIITEINDEFNLIAKDYIYLLNKKGVSNTIITLLCTLIYFGILQYLLKGQTIGKKLFKLKVVAATDKKINIINYILRTLIINEVFLNSIGIILLLATSKSVYTKTNTALSTIISLVEAITLFLVLTREDRRGLHDLLLNTKVISTDNIDIEINETIEIEEQTEGPKKTKSNKGKKKNKKKTIDVEYTENKE